MNQPAWRVLRALGVLIFVGLVACGDSESGPHAQPVALHIEAPGFGLPGMFVEVNVGTTMNLEAIPIAPDSTLLEPAVTATWQSSDTNVATISNKDVFRAHCIGVSTVTAVAVVGGRTLSGSMPVGVGTTGANCALP